MQHKFESFVAGSQNRTPSWIERSGVNHFVTDPTETKSLS